MPPRRNAPIDPGQHMSVGGNHRQYTGSSGSPQASGYQSGHPLAGSSRPARNILPQMRNAPQVEHLLPAGAHNVGMHLEDVGNNFNDNAFGPNQDPVRDYQHHHLPLTIGREDQTVLEDAIQYPPKDMYNDKSGKGTEFNIKRRKPKIKPKQKSAHAKKLEKVPGGAGSDFGPLGIIQEIRPRGLEYWYEEGKAWIPAVFHCMIRDKLINKAKTCDADVYRHPRARGEHELDVTAFLESQRDWQLERDHGWVVKDDVLYRFAKLGYESPTHEVPWMFHEGCVVIDLNYHPLNDYPDIPLTLSSKVEGALMEAIRRKDTRIRMADIWARIPGDLVNGAVLQPNGLNERITRFRLENCVPSWVDRLGTKALRDYIWNRMSPAARAANSTRELSKLSKQEQEEAKQDNIGNHDANAGGYALRKEGKDETEKQVSTTSNSQLEGATKPVPSRSKRNKGPRPTSKYNRNEESQRPSFALEQSRQTHSNKRQRFHEPTPSAACASQNSYSGPWYGDASFQLDNIPNRVQSLSTPDSQNLSNAFGSFATPTNLANSVSAQGFPIMEGLAQSEGGLNTNCNVENPYQGFQRQLVPFDPAEEDFFSTSRHMVNTFASGTRLTEMPPPLEIDYRSVPPRNEVDMRNIQDALEVTRSACSHQISSDGGPTTRYQSYFYQLQELLDCFAALWVSLGRPLPVPHLQTVGMLPWRNGFNDWRIYVDPHPDPNGRFNYEEPQ